jgi:hypothetical protein
MSPESSNPSEVASDTSPAVGWTQALLLLDVEFVFKNGNVGSMPSSSPISRCNAAALHKLRNVLGYVPKDDQAQVKSMHNWPHGTTMVSCGMIGMFWEGSFPLMNLS